MLSIANGWEITATRGPEWLFIRVVAPVADQDGAVSADQVELASAIWNALEQHFTYRVALELDAIGPLRSHLVGELIKLNKRVHLHHGMLRLAGLTDANYNVLRTLQLQGQFPHYVTSHDAVMGHVMQEPQANKPR